MVDWVCNEITDLLVVISISDAPQSVIPLPTSPYKCIYCDTDPLRMRQVESIDWQVHPVDTDWLIGCIAAVGCLAVVVC